MDGDAFITTDNPILLRNTLNSPTIVCVQRKAAKEIITEEALARSNTQSFGSDIGAITNRVTSMYEIMAGFDKSTVEYEILDYRTKCGQLLQQNSIDRTKGIISKPMPESWYLAVNVLDKPDDTDEVKAQKELYRRIVANKKPYFMNYVYPEQRTQYNKYIKASNTKCSILFGITIDELIAKENKSAEEEDFLYWYHKQMPVGMNPCVMNKVAWKVEDAFRGYTAQIKIKADFDYTILKSDVEYQQADYNEIKKLYKQYQHEMQNYCRIASKGRIDSDESTLQKDLMKQRFRVACYSIVPNEHQLCNILLDICYQSTNSKQFVWDIAGNVIIKNLLDKNNHTIKYVEHDENGNIEYCGERFSEREGTI